MPPSMSVVAAAYTLDAPTDLQEVYLRSNTSITEECDGLLPIVEGALPRELRGTLIRNGPGRLEVHGQRYNHLFDGDGHLHRFGFTDRGLVHRNRYVRTREFLEEEAARKMLFRSFGTNIPGGLINNFLRTRFKNAANTSVLWHAGRLYALWEGGLPHRIDPLTLDTLARDDLGGMLRGDTLADRLLRGGELPYSAHPRLDPTTGDLYNFGVSGGPTPTLHLYRQAPSGACLQHERTALPAMGFIHDFTLTSRYRVFFFTPATFDIRRSLLGLAAPAETLQANAESTQILLYPRRGTQARIIKARPCFAYHFANAFEDGEKVIVDAARMDRVPTADTITRMLDGLPVDYPPPILTRYTIDLRTGHTDERRLTDHPGDLPTINPARSAQPHRYVFSIARPVDRKQPYSTGLLKVDTTGPGSTFRDFGQNLTGEPVFVPRPGATAEDDGWLLSMCYDAANHTGELLILDAADLHTVARARMPIPTPLGFHGTWIPA
jgi:all-trans-8'-apo-beta-carotenal 15,15'-oxygenase